MKGFTNVTFFWRRSFYKKQFLTDIPLTRPSKNLHYIYLWNKPVNQLLRNLVLNKKINVINDDKCCWYIHYLYFIRCALKVFVLKSKYSSRYQGYRNIYFKDQDFKGIYMKYIKRNHKTAILSGNTVSDPWPN